MPAVELVDLLKSGDKARLIPVGSEKSQERRATSIFLSTLSVVDAFASSMFASLGTRIGKRAKIECFTEVVLPQEGKKEDRPDGLIVVSTGKKRWSALVEAKIGKVALDEDQVKRYLVLAKANKINAVITLSNQFAALPNHHPVKVGKLATRTVELFHWSWMFMRTQAVLQLRVEQDLDPEQRFILEEMVRYFEHPTSGVLPFDRMNREWKDVCSSVRTGARLLKTSDIVMNTVGAWHQEERDVCLMLTRELKVPVSLRLSKKHKADPELRLKDDCTLLAQECVLQGMLDIPDAAAPLSISVDIARRTVTSCMRLAAPADKISTKARVNWLLRQLRTSAPKGVYVMAEWPGRAPSTSSALAVLREDPLAIAGENTKLAPTWFSVSLVRDLAGRFSGLRSFIEEVEKAVPAFYRNVGEHLRMWVAPPPRLRAEESKNRVKEETEPESSTPS